MADSICRSLRDGALEGEHAPALTIKDSIDSPFGLDVFNHVLSQLSSFILTGKSQSRGLVLVAFSRSPSFYIDLLRHKGVDADSTRKWFRILDCYSDPLGWKYKLLESRAIDTCGPNLSAVTVFRDVKILDKLLSGIIDEGVGLVGQGKDCFSVAIDSISEMLRQSSLSSISRLLGALRSYQQVSCAFWLLHLDLHDAKEIAAMEYMSSISATLEGSTQVRDGQRGNAETVSLLDKNSINGKLHVRFKRRNGRVKLMSEVFHIEQSQITFAPISSEEETGVKSLLPKVQFNLQLSEKEQLDRSKVILPFEHQEKDKAKLIYDGRRSASEVQTESKISASSDKLPVTKESGQGEILYIRDSDEEMPDSDEDPDDDLDI